MLARELVEVLTPGTIRLDEDIGSSFILAICTQDCPNQFGLCFADCLSGRLHSAQITDSEPYGTLAALVLQFRPREVIYQSGLPRKVVRLFKSVGSVACCTSLENFASPGEAWDGLISAGYWDSSPAELVHIRTDHPMALCALAGVQTYLRGLMKDREALSHARLDSQNCLAI